MPKGTLAVELIAETVFPEIVLLFAPDSIMPQWFDAPVLAKLETVLFEIVMFGEKLAIP
jgi:hypothetical protein